MPDPSPPEGTQATKITFSGLTAWAAEGARVGVICCNLCGAAILIDPRDGQGVDRAEDHIDWHLSLTRGMTTDA